MVLIAASIFSKSGKALVSRQFVELTRARVEGLLDAFPKLVGTGKDSSNRQHTFVETDSVRYVFHPLDNIYMVLITTKASNILEDLETLRLFTRVIPEYCRSNEEKEILAKAFELMFAFDEVVSLGYRESVNLAQIRTFTDMDSHEERVFLQIKSAQEKAAKEQMDARAKEFKKQQKEALSKGLGGKGGISSLSSATSISSSSVPLTASSGAAPEPTRPAASTRPSGGGKALKLGAKAGKDDDSFIRQLRSEGQAVSSVAAGAGAGAAVRAAAEQAAAAKREPVHVRTEEKLVAEVPRDGGLKSAEVFGTVSVSVATADYNTVALQMRNGADAADGMGVMITVHPNIDKAAWATSSILRLKSANKPFPTNSDVGVLKWKATIQDEDALPITLNVWPQEAPDGCQVNIEYTLKRTDMALNDVVITVPLPTATTPVVAECEGSYEYQKSRNQLIWTIPLIDASNESGVLEFVTPNGAADHFFPVSLRFSAQQTLVDIAVEEAQKMDGSEVVSHSAITNFVVDKYDIV
ncbi:copd-1 [Pristionchus pacificus]|uniref:Coatomer subunit delta n=1 Tax=Pristionchus pacificus TaxID=54126 RepID=A0A454XNS7_PRIPA|nr:copd-1 [Pristionchus pacificus]|eukprot:PDM67864.1 copd-1 [Pristionchus pacificus]